ncbi:MAG TPA: hypothetical protein VK456_17660 [Xanthobacteraceae bacterium]|nr:hypothetical protein [Xanthobacteraceae bacterium]
MTAKALEEVLQRVETWPKEAQEDLAQIAREIDAHLAGRAYHATPEELAALDEAERSGVASDEEVEAALRSFRRG